MRWINDNSHFQDLSVEEGKSIDNGESLTFYDAANRESVRVYPDRDAPLLSRFELRGRLLDTAAKLVVGSGITEREVWHFTSKDTHKRLRAGVTMHKNAFSSLPHPFEADWRNFHGDEIFEECFYIMTPGKGLIELEGRFGRGRENRALAIRDGDLVAVPMGHHRVVALPDENGLSSMAYIWCYICARPEWEKI